jgi:hypothetical protein
MTSRAWGAVLPHVKDTETQPKTTVRGNRLISSLLSPLLCCRRTFKGVLFGVS